MTVTVNDCKESQVNFDRCCIRECCLLSSVRFEALINYNPVRELSSRKCSTSTQRWQYYTTPQPQVCIEQWTAITSCYHGRFGKKKSNGSTPSYTLYSTTVQRPITNLGVPITQHRQLLAIISNLHKVPKNNENPLESRVYSRQSTQYNYTVDQHSNVARRLRCTTVLEHDSTSSAVQGGCGKLTFQYKI